MDKDAADTRLGGLTALAKAKSAMVLNECAQTAQLLFGGNGFTESGQGELVAKIAREVAGARIPVSGRSPPHLFILLFWLNFGQRAAART